MKKKNDADYGGVYVVVHGFNMCIGSRSQPR